MKRIIALVLAAVMCLTAFVGCGAKEVKLDEVLGKIDSEYSLKLNKIENADDLTKYYSIDTKDVKQFAAEINSSVNDPVEIVLVEAVDKDAAANIERALSSRYNSILTQYAGYTPEKLDMVKACKVTNENNFVTMIVAENADGMLKIFNESVK